VSIVVQNSISSSAAQSPVQQVQICNDDGSSCADPTQILKVRICDQGGKCAKLWGDEENELALRVLSAHP
jgi:hypothetical protein